MDSERVQLETTAAKPPGTGERAFVVLILILESGAFWTLMLKQGQVSYQGGSVVWQIFWVLVYLVTISLLYRHCPGFLRQIFQAWPLVAFAALATLSTLWSSDPHLTFRRGIALSFSILLGLYLAKRFSILGQLRLLAWVFGICIFFSVPFQLLHVGSPNSYMAGAWYGVFGDKSLFGEAVALGFLVFMLLAKVDPGRRWRMRLGMLSAIVLLILSRSVTPLVATVLMVVLLPLSGTLRKTFGKALKSMTLAAMGGAVLLFLVLTHWSAFTVALGRGPTMSGRLQLWALCVVMALRKPWLGYGYGAFWLGNNGASWRIWRAMGILIAHAHNEFLQTWLNLGLVGVLLLLLILAVCITRSVRLVRRTDQPEAVWPLLLFVFIFTFMLTKIPLPEGKSLFMTIFSACLYTISSPVLETVEGWLPKKNRGRLETRGSRGMGPAAGAECV